MNSDLLARVLTIEEVKQRMKDIRTTALHYGGVIHAGERGRDEIVILSAKTWEEVSTRKPDETSAADVPSDPYTVFARAIAAGRLGSGPDAPESRRRMRELADENEFSLGEMVRMAGPEEGPPRRRRSEQLSAMPSSELPYLPEPRPLLSQGDIYLAPSVMVWSAETRQAPPMIPPPPGRPGETVYLPAWTRSVSASGAVPEVTLAASWVPVLVLSHDCEIDKEFNEQVDALIRAGMEEEEAEIRAGAMPDLDQYILVSPLLPYDEAIVGKEKWEAIRTAQKIGYYPLPPMHAYEGAEFLVHLSRVTTVERRLLTRRYKAGSLSDERRNLLRFKLAEVLSSRNLSLVSKLESAVGQRIADVRTLKAKRSEVSVGLVLEDGSELQVAAKADADLPIHERTRRPD